MSRTITKPMTLVERARAILDGRMEPDPLELPPEVKDWFDQEVKRWDPPATPEATAVQRNSLLLDALFSGEHVVYTVTSRGMLAILAVGSQEVRELYRNLDGERMKKAISCIPGPRPW